MVEHIGSHVTQAGFNDHGIGHFLLIVVLESVLSHQDLVLLLGVGDFDVLAVASAHCQIFGTVGCGVDVDLLNHAGGADQRVINGAETHQIQVGVVLVFDGVSENKILINLMGHFLCPP